MHRRIGLIVLAAIVVLPLYASHQNREETPFD
jgi:hypothetical protein